MRTHVTKYILSILIYFNLFSHALEINLDNIDETWLTNSFNKATNEIINNVTASLGGKTATTLPDYDVIASFLNLQFNSGIDNNEVTMNVTEYIKSNGFKVEIHDVETTDGYILTMFRIPGNGTTVFLMHGILFSADDWVTAGPTIGLAFFLADRGFDVWMGNARGNKHSRRHKTLSPDTDAAQFFDFSFYEIGIYDLPAMIDYVLNAKNVSKLFYVGHSQGTTNFFVMCSERPEYNSKISLMIALSPVGAVPNIKSPLAVLLTAVTLRQPQWFFTILRLIGYNEVLADSPVIRFFTIAVCGNKILQPICNTITDVSFGFDYSQANYTTLPVVYAHAPAGAATKQFEHYAQTISSGKFSKFDYGKVKNIEKYGSATPPEFPTKNITAPIAIFYGNRDQVSTVVDVLNLRRNLPSVIETYKVPYKQFKHLDFTYAKDFKTLLLPKILELINARS